MFYNVITIFVVLCEQCWLVYATDDFQNCAPYVENLKFSQDTSHLSEVNITWNSNNPKDCNFQFRIMSEAYQKPVSSSDYIQLNYYIQQVKPCTAYNFTIELSKVETNTTLYSLSQIWDTDILKENKIKNWRYNSSVHSINIAWTPHEYAEICNISYTIMVPSINKIIKIPYYRVENATHHQIKNLQSCTRYNISVIPSDVLKIQEEVGRFTNAVSTLPEKVTELDMTVDGSSSTVSWIAPMNSECIVGYNVSSSLFQKVTGDTTATLDQVLYCILVTVRPISQDKNMGEATTLIKPAPVQDLRAVPSATWVDITWESSSNDRCTAAYVVQINGLEPITTTGTKLTALNLKPCAKYDLQVRSRSTNNNYGEAIAKSFTTLLPEELGQVENLQSTQGVTELRVTWLPPRSTEFCNVEYDIELRDNENMTLFKTRTHNTVSRVNLIGALACVTYKLSVTAILDSMKSVSSIDVELLEALDKVSNLTLEVNNTSKIAWTAPRKSNCLIGYKISWSVFEIITNDTWIVSNQTLHCIEITIRPISKIGDFGETKTLIKPGPVRELHVSSSDTSISLTWLTPTNASCVDGYLVQINNSDVILVEETKFTFHNLTPCNVYEIKVQARARRNVHGNAVTLICYTTPPQNLEQVGSFKVFKYDETMLNLTWGPPRNTEACTVDYQIALTDDNNETIYNQTTNDLNVNVNFTRIVFCKRYNVSITSFVSATIGKPSYRQVEISLVRAAPKCKVVENHSNKVLMQCNFTDYTRNRCLISELIVECDNLYDNTKIEVREAKVDGPNFTVILPNLKQVTNYKCDVAINGTLGLSDKSDSIEFMTSRAAPQAPQLEEVVTYTNTSFDVMWNDVLSSANTYYVTIASLGPTYFVPSDCGHKNTSDFTSLRSLTTSYTFARANPSYRYRVFVVGSNEAGNGTASNTQVVVTKGGIPEEPRNTNFSMSKFQTDPYNVSVTIVWVYPCFTNGLMDYFQVGLYGKSYVGDNITEERIDERIKVDPVNPALNYEYTATNLKPAFQYNISIIVVTKDKLESRREQITFPSYESYPEAPIIHEASKVASKQFQINWDEPAIKNGIIKNYSVKIESQGPKYWIPDNCTKENSTYFFSLNPTYTNFIFRNGLPSHKYKVEVTSSTSIGASILSAKCVVETTEEESQEVRDLQFKLVDFEKEVYNASVEITFGHPCNTHGTFESFNIRLTGTGPRGYTEEEHFLKQRSEAYSYVLSNLLPGYTYKITVQVENEKFISTGTRVMFKSSDGVPSMCEKIAPPTANNSTAAQFVLNNNLFEEINGNILYWAFILGESNYEEKSKFGFWDGSYKSWPIVEGVQVRGSQIKPYQATPNFWNPFNGQNFTNVTFWLGINNDLFNKPLRPDTFYTFKVRGFTNNGYRDTETVTFKTPVDSKLTLILSCTFGILGTLALIILILVLLRRRRTKTKKSTKPIQLTPMPVSIGEFLKIYEQLNDSSDKLKDEFALLTEKSGETSAPIYDAVLPENKKKNRYTNVLPYDESRVRLLDNNDNDTNDYINASYIKGYSRNAEYIATQGPLEHTCTDFWKMVIQENCSLIVMVAQFVEQNKDKCYKYFPAIHENMELGNGIAVRCCTELDFKTHVVRTFLIQKDNQQWTVTHLQFTDWPDFGCPEGTEVILEFCRLMRKHTEKNPNPIIIHCSAGVGRTGTLIALDILLLAINNKDNIDIFGTVLNLRKDRRNMVQTEKQYLFIHTCIDHALHNPEPICYAVMSSDPIYENLNELKQENEHIQESKF